MVLTKKIPNALKALNVVVATALTLFATGALAQEQKEHKAAPYLSYQLCKSLVADPSGFLATHKADIAASWPVIAQEVIVDEFGRGFLLTAPEYNHSVLITEGDDASKFGIGCKVLPALFGGSITLRDREKRSLTEEFVRGIIVDVFGEDSDKARENEDPDRAWISQRDYGSFTRQNSRGCPANIDFEVGLNKVTREFKHTVMLAFELKNGDCETPPVIDGLIKEINAMPMPLRNPLVNKAILGRDICSSVIADPANFVARGAAALEAASERAQLRHHKSENVEWIAFEQPNVVGFGLIETRIDEETVSLECHVLAASPMANAIEAELKYQLAIAFQNETTNAPSKILLAGVVPAIMAGETYMKDVALEPNARGCATAAFHFVTTVVQIKSGVKETPVDGKPCGGPSIIGDVLAQTTLDVEVVE